MLSFESDYNNGAHPVVLQHLVETNDFTSLTYGFDQWSVAAREKIRIATECPNADVFFLNGGTKVGALCGEAVVFPRGNAPKHFFNTIKRHGALSAKGRTIGVQFGALFTNNLYLTIAQHAIKMAMRLKKTFLAKGYQMYIDSPSNQQFVVIPNEKVAQLAQKVEFSIWDPFDQNSKICRFVTSWATTEQQMNELESYL